jgi:hypothetical protein
VVLLTCTESLSLSAVWCPDPLPRSYVGLLGPCFKTGRMGSSSPAPPPGRRPLGVLSLGLGDGGDKPLSRSLNPCCSGRRPCCHGPKPPGSHTLFLLTISSTFYSLSKVLFIFPSRYLFAIGVLAVFSLGWSLPPILGLHSQATRLFDSASWGSETVPDGGVTLYDRPIPGDLGHSPPQRTLR